MFKQKLKRFQMQHQKFTIKMKETVRCPAEINFFNTIIRQTSQYTQCYCMEKIHKMKSLKDTPPLHLIVSILESLNHGLSKWIDFLLKPAVKNIKRVLKDLFDLINKINKLPTPLPTG